jgi:hypothetical protein
MPYEKTVRVVRMLARRTSEGHVDWQETPDEGVYQAAFPGYAVRVLARPSNDYEDPDPDYVVQLYNENGALIEVIRQDDIREGMEAEDYRESYALLRSLYEGARRHAMGVEHALDQIIEKLEHEPPP